MHLSPQMSAQLLSSFHFDLKLPLKPNVLLPLFPFLLLEPIHVKFVFLLSQLQLTLQFGHFIPECLDMH